MTVDLITPAPHDTTDCPRLLHGQTRVDVACWKLHAIFSAPAFP